METVNPRQRHLKATGSDEELAHMLELMTNINGIEISTEKINLTWKTSRERKRNDGSMISKNGQALISLEVTGRPKTVRDGGRLSPMSAVLHTGKPTILVPGRVIFFYACTGQRQFLIN